MPRSVTCGAPKERATLCPLKLFMLSTTINHPLNVHSSHPKASHSAWTLRATSLNRSSAPHTTILAVGFGGEQYRTYCDKLFRIALQSTRTTPISQSAMSRPAILNPKCTYHAFDDLSTASQHHRCKRQKH